MKEIGEVFYPFVHNPYCWQRDMLSGHMRCRHRSGLAKPLTIPGQLELWHMMGQHLFDDIAAVVGMVA
jgi:hypothetical protein